MVEPLCFAFATHLVEVHSCKAYVHSSPAVLDMDELKWPSQVEAYSRRLTLPMICVVVTGRWRLCLGFLS